MKVEVPLNKETETENKNCKVHVALDRTMDMLMIWPPPKKNRAKSPPNKAPPKQTNKQTKTNQKRTTKRNIIKQNRRNYKKILNINVQRTRFSNRLTHCYHQSINLKKQLHKNVNTNGQCTRFSDLKAWNNPMWVDMLSTSVIQS